MASDVADSSPRVSVIAVNYNGGDAVARFVESAQTGDTAPLEVIVVDNASTDRSADTVRDRAGVRVIDSPDNLGFGGGCNLGAAHAHGELLLFCNPDVRLRDDTIGCLAAHLAATDGAAVIFPTLNEPLFAEHVREPRVEDVAAMAGAVMLTTRAHFDAIGGFDPWIFLYFEDTDFCYRTWLTGRRVLKDWDAVAAHDVHGSGGGQQWSAEQIKNGLYVHLKLRRWTAVARYAGRMTVKTVVRGIAHHDPGVLAAWWTNLRELRATLAKRRAVRGAATPADRERLERLAAEHAYWLRRNWRVGVADAARRRVSPSRRGAEG